MKKEIGNGTLYCGDCLEVMKTIPDESVDAVVTDPPYFMINDTGSGFMGKKWDSLNNDSFNNIICKSKEYVEGVANLFLSLIVESCTEEEFSAQESVKTVISQKEESKESVRSAEKKSKDANLKSKVNSNSVQGIVLTKEEVLDMFKGISQNPIIAIESLPENVLFAIPYLYIRKKLRGTVQENALKFPIEVICKEKETHLSLMEEARIKGVIEGRIGNSLGNKFIREMDIHVGSAENTVIKKRFRRIISNHTNNQKIIHWIISLLFALNVTQEWKGNQKSSLMYNFHKNWAIEALRVLKVGAFAFVMCAPRNDCYYPLVKALEDAGFKTDFTPIYWTYASGFPKASNISKMVDKRLGAEREGEFSENSRPNSNRGNNLSHGVYGKEWKEGTAITPQAKALNGSYGGFQPKPAVEVIIVAMKPLSEKTYVDQAMKNKKGITWLDDCRVPYENQKDMENTNVGFAYEMKSEFYGQVPHGGQRGQNQNGRFPANLLVSDDVLNDGRITESRKTNSLGGFGISSNDYGENSKDIDYERGYSDSGSFSRYFSLDAWYEKNIKKLPKEAQKTYPFLIVPKASRGEKNEGCENKNIHPTVKPLKLMSYLITLGSCSGDIVLDPFLGSGTTAIACEMLGRRWIGIEKEEQYIKIAEKRIEPYKSQQKLEGGAL